jgi:anti-sigma B factor antagonist
MAEGESVPSNGPFAVERKDHGEVAVAVLHGELDIASADQLQRVLDGIVVERRSGLVDMTDLRFIDSSGLSVLIRAWKALEAQGQTLAMVAPVAAVRRVLGVSGLDALFRIYETNAEGLEGIAAR